MPEKLGPLANVVSHLRTLDALDAELLAMYGDHLRVFEVRLYFRDREQASFSLKVQHVPFPVKDGGKPSAAQPVVMHNDPWKEAERLRARVTELEKAHLLITQKAEPKTGTAWEAVAALKDVERAAKAALREWQQQEEKFWECPQCGYTISDELYAPIRGDACCTVCGTALADFRVELRDYGEVE